MTRVETLREQGRVLRALAQSFHETPAMAADLEALAKRCDELAEKAEHEIAGRLARPISQSA